MKIAAVQHDIAWEDPERNFARLAPMIASARAAGADLVLLAEMFATGFSMQTERIAEEPDGPSVAFLREQAATAGAWIGGSAALRDGPTRPRNVFVLAGPGGELHRYAKIHPFSYAGEHEVYEAGTDVITVDVGGLRVTPFVCYDLRFGDRFWDTAADTDVYVVVANWPAARRAHWQALLRARAIENQAYVAGVNRVGDGDGIAYAGDTAVIDPLGEALVTATTRETILVADVDPGVVRAVRERYPFLRDR